MIAILCTFAALISLMVLTHRALGRPQTNLVAALRLCGWLTIAFIALNQGAPVIAAVSGLLATLADSGPSG